ncbi:MAG: hypothetical protein WD467_02060 [Candidatus Saccharimonadales bacterium]
MVLLLIGTSVPAQAITDEDLRAINKDAVYYGGETIGQQLCGTIATDQYPVLTPEIRDAETLAGAIDEYIDNNYSDSPFRDMGKYFVEGGMRAGINPVLAVALTKHESGMGTNEKTTALEANNGFGRTANARTQPYVQPSSRVWYAWDSWQDSLYSPIYPADGTVSQPDDIFQYIARRYEGNLERGLEAFLEGRGSVAGYAPSSDGNNVADYVKDVTNVTNEIAELAGSAIDLTRINPGGGSCGALGDVVQTALLYAWPDYRSPPYTNMKPEYEQAIRSAIGRDEYVGGGVYPGIDCGGFVIRTIRDSGLDREYGGYGGTDTQHRYLEQSSNWQKVAVSSTADLAPGDVAIRSAWYSGARGHTYMYVGEQPGFETHVASASYGGNRNSVNWRTPMAGYENVLGGDWSWYRFVGGGGDE